MNSIAAQRSHAIKWYLKQALKQWNLSLLNWTCVSKKALFSLYNLITSAICYSDEKETNSSIKTYYFQFIDENDTFKFIRSMLTVLLWKILKCCKLGSLRNTDLTYFLVLLILRNNQLWLVFKKNPFHILEADQQTLCPFYVSEMFYLSIIPMNILTRWRILSHMFPPFSSLSFTSCWLRTFWPFDSLILNIQVFKLFPLCFISMQWGEKYLVVAWFHIILFSS